jgi:hypothetical protein
MLLLIFSFIDLFGNYKVLSESRNLMDFRACCYRLQSANAKLFKDVSKEEFEE